MVAAGKGRLEEAAALLAAGADAGLKAANGMAARDWAAKFGHEEVATYLDSHAQVRAARRAGASCPVFCPSCLRRLSCSWVT